MYVWSFGARRKTPHVRLYHRISWTGESRGQATSEVWSLPDPARRSSRSSPTHVFLRSPPLTQSLERLQLKLMIFLAASSLPLFSLILILLDLLTHFLLITEKCSPGYCFNSGSCQDGADSPVCRLESNSSSKQTLVFSLAWLLSDTQTQSFIWPTF